MRFALAVICVAVATSVAAAVESSQLMDVDGYGDGDADGYSEYSYPLFGESNMTALGALAMRFEAQLRDRNETSVVRLQLHMWWMRRGEITNRGCGFRAQADGNRNSTAAVRFPAIREHMCLGEDGELCHDTYMMRTTSMSEPVVYEARLHLPGPSERARWVQVHADGHRRTYVEYMCVGTHDRPTGYRTLCIDRFALDACARLTGDSVAVFKDSDFIPMARTRNSMRLIVFQDLDSVFAGFWRLVRNGSDKSAQSAFCEGIAWIRGNADPNARRYCDAETADNVRKYGWNSMDPVAINPDLCIPLIDP